MASTDTVRGWFQETVSNHDQRGIDGYEPKCNWSIAKVVAFPAEGGGVYNEPVHPATVEAFEAFVKLMEHYGETMPIGGGVNSCRNIAGTDWPSLHAYLVAVDLPPNSRVSEEFLEAVLRVRTNSGATVFLNGRIFNDRMHFQLNCSPEDLATGIDWSTVEGEDMPLTQDDKDFIIAAVRGDNVEQTESVWHRYVIRDSEGNSVPLVRAIEFIYRKLEKGTAELDPTEIADLTVDQIKERL